jgi:hypothetical protein
MHGPHHTEFRTSRRRARWVWGLFAALALYYLLTEHRAHVTGALGWLPLGLLLLCPLMHVFMHGRHGSEAVHGTPAREPRGAATTSPVIDASADEAHHRRLTEQ